MKPKRSREAIEWMSFEVGGTNLVGTRKRSASLPEFVPPICWLAEPQAINFAALKSKYPIRND